jgi:hypothetical protein
MKITGLRGNWKKKKESFALGYSFSSRIKCVDTDRMTQLEGARKDGPRVKVGSGM